MIKKLLMKRIIAAVGVATMLLSNASIQTLPVQASAVVKETQKPKLTYQARVSNFGWKGVVSENQIAGTTGEARPLTQFICSLQDANGKNAIRFRSHIRNIGWEKTWKQSWQISGSADTDKCIEAIRIQLVGSLAKKYDIYYRIHVQELGWMSWVCNGEKAGTEGLALPAEAIQIKLVKKGTSVSREGMAYIDGTKKPTLTYQAKVNHLGWKGVVSENQIAGTTGEARPLKLINCHLKDFNGANGILFRSHIRNMGWESEWKQSGQTSGWNAPDRCIEAVQMQLVGFLAQKYDIYYRLHVQNIGWMGWSCNGEKAGTEGLALPAEAIQIKLVQKGTSISREGTAYIDGTKKTNSTDTTTTVNRDAEIINSIQKTFNAFKNKKSTWTSKCPALVYWQLVERGYLSQADPSAAYGYQMARQYAERGTTRKGYSMIGYPCKKSTAKSTLDQIIRQGNGVANNIVVSFDGGSGLSKAGHVMLITRIENGKVYFIDNTTYCKGRNGQYQPISMTLKEYKTKYLSNWSCNYMTVIK